MKALSWIYTSGSYLHSQSALFALSNPFMTDRVAFHEAFALRTRAECLSSELLCMAILHCLVGVDSSLFISLHILRSWRRMVRFSYRRSISIWTSIFDFAHAFLNAVGGCEEPIHPLGAMLCCPFRPVVQCCTSIFQGST